MDNLFVHFKAETDVPDEVNQATHRELVEFCKKYLPAVPPPEPKTVRRIVAEIFRFNSSKCLCWDLAGTSGHGGPRRIESAKIQGAVQAAPSHTSLHDKITQLSASTRSFLRIFSICGKEVMGVLQSVLSEVGTSEQQGLAKSVAPSTPAVPSPVAVGVATQLLLLLQFLAVTVHVNRYAWQLGD